MSLAGQVLKNRADFKGTSRYSSR